MKLGCSTGRPERAGAEAGCRVLENGSGKKGAPEASWAERAGNIDHTAMHRQSFESVSQKTGGGILDPL